MRLALLDIAHERVLPVVALALGFGWAGITMADATGMGAPQRVALDFALWWSWLFGCGLAMWLGSRCIARPLADRTAVWMLAGPIGPGAWGLQRVTAAVLFALGAFAIVLLGFVPVIGLPAGLPAYTALTGLEIVLLTTLAGALGTLFRPLPSLALTAALWWVGHLAGMWADLMAESGASGLAGAVLAAVPDLDLLDVHGVVVAGAAPPATQVGWATVWSLAWICAAAAATVAVLNRRDLP